MELNFFSNIKRSLIACSTYHSVFIAVLGDFAEKQSNINFADECFSYSEIEWKELHCA